MYAEALKADIKKINETKNGPSKVGFPPTAKADKKKNRFSPLTTHDEEVLDYIDDTSNSNKRSSGKHTAEVPNKKKKIQTKTSKDDDFNAVCDEYAQLLVPEYSYSVQNTGDDNEVDLLRCDEKMSASS